MMSEFSKVVLKSGKADSVKRFHPWIFSGAIKKIYGEVNDGEIVTVYSNKDEFLALGHFQNSSISVRALAFEETEIDDVFWKEKIQNAYNLRMNLGLVNSLQTDVYRLVHAEGDGLPGLIIDFYNGVAVMQCHSIGMHKAKEHIKDALLSIYGNDLIGVYDKSAETLPSEYKSQIENGFLYENGSHDGEVSEYTNRFQVDWEKGQKTGFFIDQRENRKLLGELAKDKTVLNTYCYTGGFSISALNGGAKLVHSVDSSKKAIELTEKNIEMNGFSKDTHKCFASDTLDFLKENDTTYDIIILDPPAFAKHKNVRHNAVQGYKRINREALKKLNKGGILFTFSCSQVVNKQLFTATFISAAIQSEKKVRILYQLTQPADHPISAFHPEGEYLKGIVAIVD